MSKTKKIVIGIIAVFGLSAIPASMAEARPVPVVPVAPTKCNYQFTDVENGVTLRTSVHLCGSKPCETVQVVFPRATVPVNTPRPVTVFSNCNISPR